ncbi:hypothetical protein COW36_02370 [bacterium (Candidatus Blackallbacteria) CG17_big_fil_post_rev_8_21_14_2_50_48_46]|uniref:Uncharacterized protein n=1 Tax=bacterium (Candidatus Blackallbacteria) CG17_big_fil_post_rev_8_21_14_2_50_48_46 TaxID=2014261 RepID=A0A2M7GA54_9BACT|nr:MAG: hypothetical protein COW64_13100 [bacterium (Candidatus Blackallbacteria) CG18_big_fil_WC_8_21_14_2_50_49_26]PIW18974.1 MAG: hypothetical protein COW36_02370 [bacterium (Candidatus Blackallbacteria) CG17_big_fil_post_rev_8_21_14_2_50_48_46]PIW44658.1 MAG: hypothetical protein COW20_23745 [bacterium (Candidatus Blackallbacteria) CG13_big_fil_rev_8_21_14_2_50_49_14]
MLLVLEKQNQLNSGTFLQNARLCDELALSRKDNEELKNRKHIWVNSETMKFLLLKQGFLAEQICLLPPKGPDGLSEQLKELHYQLRHLSEKLKLLRS